MSRLKIISIGVICIIVLVLGIIALPVTKAVKMQMAAASTSQNENQELINMLLTVLASLQQQLALMLQQQGLTQSQATVDETDDSSTSDEFSEDQEDNSVIAFKNEKPKIKAIRKNGVSNSELFADTEMEIIGDNLVDSYDEVKILINNKYAEVTESAEKIVRFIPPSLKVGIFPLYVKNENGISNTVNIMVRKEIINPNDIEEDEDESNDSYDSSDNNDDSSDESDNYNDYYSNDDDADDDRQVIAQSQPQVQPSSQTQTQTQNQVTTPAPVVAVVQTNPTVVVPVAPVVTSAPPAPVTVTTGKYVNVSFSGGSVTKGSNQLARFTWATNIRTSTVNIVVVSQKDGSAYLIKQGVANDGKGGILGTELKGVPVGNYIIRVNIIDGLGNKVKGDSAGVLQVKSAVSFSIMSVMANALQGVMSTLK